MVDVRSTFRSAALGSVILLSMAGCKPIDDAMVSVFGRSMRVQPSVKPYENPQLPPEGALPFAAGNFAAEGDWNVGQAEEGVEIHPPFEPRALLTGGTPYINGLVNPVAPTEASLARGEEMFLRVCAPCHGPAADGNGYIVQSGAYPLVYPLISGNSLTYSDGYIYAMIRVGRGGMPAYGHQVTDQDRWKIVLYLRELQRRAGADVAAAPGTP